MKQKKMNWKEMSIGLCLVALLAWFTFYVLLSGHSPPDPGQYLREGGYQVRIHGVCLHVSVRQL